MIWLVCKSETDISVVIFKITRSTNKHKSLKCSFLSLIVTRTYVCVYVSMCFVVKCYLSVPSCGAKTYFRLPIIVIRACVGTTDFDHNVHFLWTCILKM